MNEFEVSVIIPVFNASQFLERAVLSALNQPETTEVILVEDGSTDSSLNICKELANTHQRIKLLTHPNNENRGAGASRNLGILNASCEFISFLDADDYFLPNRFLQTKKLFFDDPEIQGVYEPVSCEFVTESDKLKFMKMKNLRAEQLSEYISYPVQPLSGKEFFESLILGTNGYPCTDGITVTKKLFKVCGLYNTNLRLHQDSELLIRMAYYGKFSTPLSKRPIAIRTQHPNNRITSRSQLSQLKFVSVLLKWAISENIDSYLVEKIKLNEKILLIGSQKWIPSFVKKIVIFLINLFQK